MASTLTLLLVYLTNRLQSIPTSAGRLQIAQVSSNKEKRNRIQVLNFVQLDYRTLPIAGEKEYDTRSTKHTHLLIKLFQVLRDPTRIS